MSKIWLKILLSSGKLFHCKLVKRIWCHVWITPTRWYVCFSHHLPAKMCIRRCLEKIHLDHKLEWKGLIRNWSCVKKRQFCCGHASNKNYFKFCDAKNLIRMFASPWKVGRSLWCFTDLLQNIERKIWCCRLAAKL